MICGCDFVKTEWSVAVSVLQASGPEFTDVVHFKTGLDSIKFQCKCRAYAVLSGLQQNTGNFPYCKICRGGKEQL